MTFYNHLTIDIAQISEKLQVTDLHRLSTQNVQILYQDFLISFDRQIEIALKEVEVFQVARHASSGLEEITTCLVVCVDSGRALGPMMDLAVTESTTVSCADTPPTKKDPPYSILPLHYALVILGILYALLYQYNAPCRISTSTTESAIKAVKHTL